jgi:FkbM family methyltransferase
MEKSYSQLNQDIECLKFYKNMPNGYYVDVGANDGISLSNTYILEKKYGWKGICMEPMPSVFEKLVSERPNAICINKAGFSESGKIVQFDEIVNSPMLSGISKFNTNYNNIYSKNTLSVETITLTDALNAANSPAFIHYLSLDTEGSEYEILKGIDFNKYTFGLIDLEHNFKEPNRTQIREYLKERGYNFVKENKWDDVYVHRSLHSEYLKNNYFTRQYKIPSINVKMA